VRSLDEERKVNVIIRQKLAEVARQTSNHLLLEEELTKALHSEALKAGKANAELSAVR